MATYQQNLITARDACLARLNEVLAAKKPSYSVDGQSISWTEYASMLTDQLDKFNHLIQQADGAFEISVRNFT